jgi:DNA-binding beta-propeller fold protein YncE
VIAIIPISKKVQRISLSTDDRWAFTTDQTEPRLAVVDTATNQLKTWVALPSLGHATAPTRDGRWLLVALKETNKVAVVDLKEMKVVRTLDVLASPQSILVRPDNRVAYVACMKDGKIAVINLTTWQVDKVIDAGKLADGMAWAAAP